jgi:hypothetical protein
MIPEHSPHAASISDEKPKRLILVAMDKGGVGKSFFTILLTQWLRAHKREFLAFDPDYHNSTLTRFVPEAQFLDIRHSENLDRIIEVMQEHPLVVVDGVGSQQRIFLDWLEETNLLKLRHAMRLELTLVLIVEEDKAALAIRSTGSSCAITRACARPAFTTRARPARSCSAAAPARSHCRSSRTISSSSCSKIPSLSTARSRAINCF